MFALHVQTPASSMAPQILPRMTPGWRARVILEWRIPDEETLSTTGCCKINNKTNRQPLQINPNSQAKNREIWIKLYWDCWKYVALVDLDSVNVCEKGER